MAVRLENYFFCTTEHLHVILPDESKIFSLGGNCFNHPFFEDGETIQTASILKMDKEIAISKEGNEFSLGKMHPHYYDLILARDSNIPIINSWYFTGNKEAGFTIHGLSNHVTVSGLIAKQEGNYIWINDQVYYVIWFNWDVPFWLYEEEKETMIQTHTYHGLNIETDFDYYLHDLIRPKLFD